MKASREKPAASEPRRWRDKPQTWQGSPTSCCSPCFPGRSLPHTASLATPPAGCTPSRQLAQAAHVAPQTACNRVEQEREAQAPRALLSCAGLHQRTGPASTVPAPKPPWRPHREKPACPPLPARVLQPQAKPLRRRGHLQSDVCSLLPVPGPCPGGTLHARSHQPVPGTPPHLLQ